MLSNEMLSLGKKPSVIRELFEYGNKRKAEIGAENVFDFSLGNPSIPAPEIVNEIMSDLINNKDSIALHGYTSAPGDMAVRSKIADNITKRFGFEADAGLIYMSCGAAAALTSTLKALCNTGDEVLTLAPYFPEYDVFTANAGATLKPVKCKEDFSADIDAISSAINEKNKAIIINSPNNPSGAVLSEDDIKALSKLLSDKSKEIGSTIYIIADEPYREIVYDNCFVPFIPCYYDNTIICYSYSKSLSLPGERIGYVLVSPKAENAYDVFAAVCGAARAIGYVCAPSLLQYTAAACDGTPPNIEQYDVNRKLLYNSLCEMGYTAVKPQGAFYLFVKALEDDAVHFCEMAKKHELLLVPSNGFGIEGYVRISYCVTEDMIKRSLPAFEALFEDYSK